VSVALRQDCRILTNVLKQQLKRHSSIIFVNNELDAQFFFMYIYFYSLHVLRAAMCPSSGELIVSI
jgi:hypothetical protein